VGSVAVADVPDRRLDRAGDVGACQDLLAALLLPLELGGVCFHRCLAGGVVGSSVVGDEHGSVACELRVL